MDDRGRLLVCFDFEGGYGMPHRMPYDLAGTPRHPRGAGRPQARAVFFVVGRMVEEHPEVVASLAAAGHEIGLHGYEHDDLARYDAEGVALLDKNLGRVASLLEQMTGPRRSASAPRTCSGRTSTAATSTRCCASRGSAGCPTARCGTRSNCSGRGRAWSRRTRGGPPTAPPGWSATGCCSARSTRSWWRRAASSARRRAGCAGCSAGASRSPGTA